MSGAVKRREGNAGDEDVEQEGGAGHHLRRDSKKTHGGQVAGGAAKADTGVKEGNQQDERVEEHGGFSFQRSAGRKAALRVSW